MDFKFSRESNSNLFLLNIEIDNVYELKMILDTGATHTTIDSNALHLLGYDLIDSIGTVQIETANEIIETEVFEIEIFWRLVLKKINFKFKFMIFLLTAFFLTIMDY